MSSMRIQEAFTNCCEGMKDFASQAASGVANALTTVGSAAAETLQKVAKLAQPHFDKLMKFGQENKQSILIAAIACAFGAIATVVFSRVCSREQTPPVTTALSSATTTSITV